MTEAAAAVEARSLSYRYPSGRAGVVEVDLVVAPGERVVVLGPNGSGKSTLLRLFAGLLRPDEGWLSALGWDPAAPDAPRRRVGVALDHAAHFEALTAAENAVLFVRAAGLDPRSAAEAVEGALGLFGLEPSVAVRDCSTGMRRRLLLAETLAHHPDLLLLDEPTLGLDPDGVDLLGGALAERSGAGAASLVATNDVHAATVLGTRVVFMLGGRKAEDAPIDELLAGLRARTRIEVTLGPDGTAAGDVMSRADAPRDLQLFSRSNTVVADSRSGAERLPALLGWLLGAGARIRDVRVREPDLGDVFRELTGASLTGEEES